MHLIEAHVKNYKIVTDSTRFWIEPGVTCLVGKNESGKSAVLEAMYRLNPLPAGLPTEFNGLRDYPRQNFAVDEEKVPNVAAIGTTFELNADEVGEFERHFGKGALRSRLVLFNKTYANKLLVGVDLDEVVVLEHVKAQPALAGLDVHGANTVDELKAVIDAVVDPPAAVSNLRQRLDVSLSLQARVWMARRLPRFLLFTQYSTIPGSVSIDRLQTVPEQLLDPHERTALSLLRLAKVDSERFDESNYEARRARLEAAANALTDEVFAYWSQNPDLQVELDIDFVPKNSPTRANWSRSFVFASATTASASRSTFPIGQQDSSGSSPSSLSSRSSAIIPASTSCCWTSRVSPCTPWPTSTSCGSSRSGCPSAIRWCSPPTRRSWSAPRSSNGCDCWRTTRSKAPRSGTTHSAARTRRSSRSSAAIGIKAAELQFVDHNTLVVEAPADLLFLRALGEHLSALGRVGLNATWNPLPVGALDKIPSFLAQLGQHAVLAFVHNSDAKTTRQLKKLVDSGAVPASRVLGVLAYAKSSKSADLEDLFDEDWYLDLLTRSGVVAMTSSDVKSRDARVVRRVENFIGDRYSRYAAAAYLTSHPELLDDVGDAALDRFEALFTDLNKLL